MNTDSKPCPLYLRRSLLLLLCAVHVILHLVLALPLLAVALHLLLLALSLRRVVLPDSYITTSGFWPRVRARALRAPVFLRSLPRKKGRCAPPPPIAASLLLIRSPKIFTIYRTWAANVKGFFFSTGPQRLWNMRPYVLILSFFLFSIVFCIFSFCYSLFLLSFTLQTYPSFWGIFRGGQAYFVPFGVTINIYTGATIRPNFFLYYSFSLI